MISHISHRYTDSASLDSFLDNSKLQNTVSRASSVLVQMYSASTDAAYLHNIACQIKSKLPAAILVGSTTVGEIHKGLLLTNSTVIGITCFESTTLNLIAHPCQDDNLQELGQEIGTCIKQQGQLAGVLLLATTLNTDTSLVLQGIESVAGSIPVFGGGAGDYAAIMRSLVFTHEAQYTKGVVAVVFTGPDLHIESNAYLGWRPLSKKMQVTCVDNMLVKSVDGKPAFDVYKRYLNIANDEKFFLNALEFPFLMERNGDLLARVPVAATPEGALQFVADIQAGEYFRIGYGDIDLIVNDAHNIHQLMEDFSPQVIFLYTCGCRRFLMQTDVELETRPFNNIAPAFGFYTYGEFYTSRSLRLLNSTMVAVGLREGPAKLNPQKPSPQKKLTDKNDFDPYAHQHTRVVSHLMRFIDAVTLELENSNREITKLSQTDRLTQLVNRIQLDRVLEENLQWAQRHDSTFSVILLDLDHFKSVNDAYGHLVGDQLLVDIAKILATSTRNTDTVGRWGGEEFLIILPHTQISDAIKIAEKLRTRIDEYDFPVARKMTASFGVTGFTPSDDVVKLINRADVALYAAKDSGRNRVEISV